MAKATKSKKKRHIAMECPECKGRLYTYKSKGKLPNPPKLELSKYCRNCKKHVVHKETK